MILKNKAEIAILILIPMIFLYKMIFFNEVVTTNDELERYPINEWRDNYLVNNDEIPQWYPNLFSGMPSYGGYIYTDGDPIKSIRNVILFNPGLKIWFYLSLCGVGMFIFLKLFGISRHAALFGSLVASLTPYSFGLINAGHLNKIFAMAYTPWVIAATINLLNKVNIKSILLLAIATALQLWANHPQIAYYTWMLIGFYFVWELGNSFYRKTFIFKKNIKIFLGLLLSVFIALIMVSDPYMEIFKFQKESDRGLTSVLENTQSNTNLEKKWEYATRWSFHPAELISFIFPYYYGLQNIEDINKGAYWGYMPFTQSTHYLGLVVLIFSIIGLLGKKPNKDDKAFWIISILTLVTGFGSFFPLLFEPFFHLFPFFSKFRVPSMIYVLLAVSFPFLGARGLDIFIENFNNNKIFNIINKLFLSLLLIILVFLIFENSIISYNTSGDARYNPNTITFLKEARSTLFQKGLLLALFISIGLYILLSGFLKNRINKKTFIFILISITLIDLGIVNFEFLNLKKPQNFNLTFKSNSKIDYMVSDKDHFRIFPADKMGSNYYSYWNLESIAGYRPIKLRNYQDIMDAGGLNNPKILNMLNVKYVVTRKKINNSSFNKVPNINGLYENENFLPKSWVVNTVIPVENQSESLHKTLSSNFDPNSHAVLINYDGKFVTEKSSGSSSIIERSENMILLKAKSETGGILVLSEIYYAPGWKAYVNGANVPIYQANHILRSIEIPTGESDVLFVYDIKTWRTARVISRSAFIGILFFLGFLFYKDNKKI